MKPGEQICGPIQWRYGPFIGCSNAISNCKEIGPRGLPHWYHIHCSSARPSALSSALSSNPHDMLALQVPHTFSREASWISIMSHVEKLKRMNFQIINLHSLNQFSQWCFNASSCKILHRTWFKHPLQKWCQVHGIMNPCISIAFLLEPT